MKTLQRQFSIEDGWDNKSVNPEANLILAFAAPSLIKKENTFKKIKSFFPNADIILTSTAGEILDTEVCDETISVSELFFEKTPLKVISKEVKKMDESLNVGIELANELKGDDLKYVLIFSDGLGVNGTKLVEGLNKIFENKIGITGGLAGDGANFSDTYVSLNSEINEKNNIVAVGLYGENINIGNSSIGGWENFGIERKITKSKDNIVYEIDGEPILDLYKKYLGNKAEELPGSGLLFPISIYEKEKKNSLIRTLLAIDEKEKCITFAGDVPEGYNACLMKSNFNGLVNGAKEAAEISFSKNGNPDFALLISCIGRKIVLKQRVEEEVEIIREVIGEKAIMSGFYSYGEIGINKGDGKYNLHNQTMTIALLSEK